MAEIIPPPSQGSILELDLFTGSWAAQPSRGSILELDLFTGSWAAQPSRGSILELDLFTGWQQGGWHVGKVVW